MSGTRIPAASCPDCGQILLIVIGEPDVAEWAEKVLLHQCPAQTPREPAPTPAEQEWLATEPSTRPNRAVRRVVRWVLVAVAVLTFTALVSSAEHHAQPAAPPTAPAGVTTPVTPGGTR